MPRKPFCLVQVAALLFVFTFFPGCSSKDDSSNSSDSGAPDPTLSGPYPVGNVCLYMIDPSRHDRSYQSDRQLLVEVWYPAVAKTPGQPEGRIIDFIDEKWVALVELVFGFLLPEEEMEYFQKHTGSFPNALPDLENGPYPLILFSHGNGSIRFSNYTLARHLASHGYIFAAPDHTENAAFAALPDDLVIFNPLLTPKSFIDRPQDLQFVLDRLLEKNAPGSGDFFEGMMDPDRIAISGHSFGGTPVMLLAQFDPRFKAGLTFAGPWIDLALFSLEIPMMYMIGLEDKSVGIPYNDWIVGVYRESPPPKFLIEFPDGGHYTFTDACGMAPTLFGTGDGCGEGNRYEDDSTFTYIDYQWAQTIVHAYATAFFDYTIKESKKYEPWLITNHYPEDIVLSSALP